VTANLRQKLQRLVKSTQAERSFRTFFDVCPRHAEQESEKRQVNSIKPCQFWHGFFVLFASSQAHRDSDATACV
jgi:hypothetical protein